MGRYKSHSKSCHIWQQKHIYITFLESHWHSNMISNEILIDCFGFERSGVGKAQPPKCTYVLITFLRSKENIISVWKNIVSLKYMKEGSKKCQFKNWLYPYL